MRPLQPGDAIGVVSPASAADNDVISGFATLANQRGYRIKLFGGGDRFGRMSASDAQRTRHLLDAFEDDSVAAIVAARGGYGSGRLLEHINPKALNPKILVGYSDITNLLLHIQGQAGFPTFHGPMAIDLVQKRNQITIHSFFQTLEGKRCLYSLLKDKGEFTPIRTGVASGPMFGGNISILNALAGTSSLRVPDGAILILEDVNEFMYALDRSLVHLRRTGLFDRVTAILFADMRLRDGSDRDNSLGMLLEDVIEDHFRDFAGPIAVGLPCGHTQRQLTLPFGCPAQVEISDDALSLSFEDLWRTAPPSIAARKSNAAA